MNLNEFKGSLGRRGRTQKKIKVNLKLHVLLIIYLS